MGKFPIPFLTKRKNQNGDYKFVESAFGEEQSVENIKNKICSRYTSKEEVIKCKTSGKKLLYKCSTNKLRKIKGIITYYLLLLIFIKSLSKERIKL